MIKFQSEIVHQLVAEHGRATVWICLLVIVAAPVLMLMGLGAAPFWVDEAIAALPAEQIHHSGLPKNPFDLDFLPFQLEDGLWDPATPLYRYSLAAFTVVTGFSEFTARSFSVLMGFLLAVPLFGLVRRLYDNLTALLSVTFILASPAFMYHAREARHFTFVMLLTTMTLYFLHRGQAEPESRANAWWFLSLVAALLAQTLAYAVVYVVGSYILLNGGPLRFLSKRWWPYYLVWGGVYATVMALFWHTLPFFNSTGCFNHSYGCHPSFFFYLGPLSEFLAPSPIQRAYAPPFTVFSLNHLLFPLGLGATLWWARTGKMKRSEWSLVLLWFLLPFYLLSIQDVKFDRYLFQWVMPGVAIFTAVGLLMVLRSRRLERYRRVAIPLLVLLIVLAPQVDLRQKDFRRGLWRYVKNEIINAPDDNFERIRWQVERLEQGMDAADVVVSSYDDASLQYYIEQPVYGLLASWRSDEFFNELLDEAERERFLVWFVDTLPEFNVCLINPEDPVEVDCRVKYPRFYARCTSPARRSPACARIRVDPLETGR
jgi:hypothetical protein